MHRSLVFVTLIAPATAAPREAQGRGHGNRKETRTYTDARGRECRETTHYKQNGKDKYDLKCKAAKGNRGHGDDRWDDDDDRDERRGDARDCRDRSGDDRCDVAQNSRYPDTRYPDSRYPDSRYPGTGTNNPDSRYPSSGTSYPSTLPDMGGAVVFGSRIPRRTADVSRWLGDGNYTVRYSDSNRDGRPERASWLDSSGRVVQQWIDSNGDGRADQVRIFENGRLTRTIGR
jgi:hypothetical protein